MLPLVKSQEPRNRGLEEDRIKRATNRAGYANEKTEACKNHHENSEGQEKCERQDKAGRARDT